MRGDYKGGRGRVQPPVRGMAPLSPPPMKFLVSVIVPLGLKFSDFMLVLSETAYLYV